jgi:hypothetical protein
LFFPIVGTVHLARPLLCRKAVAFPIEQQQRVIAGELEVAVVGFVLLLAIHFGNAKQVA